MNKPKPHIQCYRLNDGHGEILWGVYLNARRVKPVWLGTNLWSCHRAKCFNPPPRKAAK